MSLLRSSLVIGVWTMASRVLGFVRDVLIANFLGAGALADAWVVAFRFPNLFRRLVGEGAFTAAYIPIFSRKLEAEGQAAAGRFAGETLSVLLAVLLAFTVAAEIAMPWLMRGIAPGFIDDPAKFDTAVLFTRITLPYLLCMALVALLGGALNALYRFAAMAAAPVLLNVVLIGVMLGLRDEFETVGHALVWGVAAAGIGQFLWLALACRRAGLVIRLPRPRLTPEVRHLLKLMGPGAVGAGAQQLNLLVGTILSTYIAGAASWLYYADRIYQLPLGVIGLAIGTALLPSLSRALQSEPERARREMDRAVEIAMLFTVPAAVALMVIPQAIVTGLFEYGRFQASDAAATSAALIAFSAGLPGYVLVRVLAPGFFAREDTRTPVIYAVASMVVNSVLALALMIPFGHVGIAAATAVAAWLNAGLLAWGLARRAHWTMGAAARGRLARIVLASAGMGAALWAAQRALAPWLDGPAYERIAALAALVAGGLVVYGALALLLRAADPAELRAVLRRRGREPRPEEAPPGA